MAYSRVVAIGDGTTTQFAVNFALDYLLEADVTCRVGTEVDGGGSPLYRTITFISTNLIEVAGTPAGVGVEVVFERTVDKDALRVDYNNGDALDEDNLMIAQKQAMMAVHEVLDGRFSTLTADLDFGGFKAVNLGTPTTDTDAATKSYVDDNTAEAIAAGATATAAAATATAASTSASTSASNSAASATSAAASAATAEAAVAGLNLPSLTVADARKQLTVKTDGSGIQVMKRTLLLPDDFGWSASDTLANRHAAMVAWAADSNPGALDRNTDYQIDLSTGALLVAAGKIIEGNGASIYDTVTTGLMLDLIPGVADTDGVLEGGWKISDLTLVGTGNSVANVAGIALRVMGTDNIATASAPDYVHGPVLDNIKIDGFAGYGVWDQFTLGTRVTNPKIRNIGYAGYGLHSGKDFRMHRHTIEFIGPGVGASMYGFYASRREEGGRLTDFTASPRPEDFEVSYGRVTDSGYSAIDTHGGIDGKFNFNTIRRCEKGINIGAGSTAFAGNVGALNCQAVGNILYGLIDTKATSPAIYVVGGSTDGSSTIATNGWTRNAIVEGNQIYGWGNPDTHDMGGIMLQGTRNAKIRGNTIEHCARWGVCARYQNYDFDISGNSITDSFSNAAYGGGIGVTSLNNRGRIGGNTLRTDGGAGTIVMNVGVYLEDLATVFVDMYGDTFAGTITTHYFKGASATLYGKPLRQSGKATVTFSAGNAAQTVAVGFPIEFSAAPVVTGIHGPSYFDTNELIYGFSSLTATQMTLTARTVDGTSIGTTGGAVEIHWCADGY